MAPRLTRTLDFAALLGIAVALAVIYVLVPGDSPLVFNYSDPSVLTMWTAAAHHDSVSHLISNTTTYALVIGVTYHLYAAQERRTNFWVIVVGCLLITPLVTTAADYWLLVVQWDIVAASATAQGFSGVVTALVGVLFVSLIRPTAASISSNPAKTTQPPWALLAVGWVIVIVLTVTLLQTGFDPSDRFVNGFVHLVGLSTGSLIATAVLLCDRYLNIETTGR